MIYILHYSKDDVTHQCVKSVLLQGDVLVIDNGSPVPYQPIGPEKVMRLEQNLFLIGAFNAAMQMYPDKWYLCLNNDTVASPGMVNRLLDVLADPNIGIVAPGSSDENAGVLYVPYPDGWQDVFTNHVDNHAWMFTQDVVDEIGYPDAVGHTHRACWYANRYYCWKARMVGYKVMAVRSAYIQHLHEGGYDEIADKEGFAWIRGRMGQRVEEAL